MALSLSSTAIALQTLNERNLLPTRAGQSAFAILLFQDISVIAMIALIPLLTGDVVTSEGGVAWLNVVKVAGVIGGGSVLFTVAALEPAAPVEAVQIGDRSYRCATT